VIDILSRWTGAVVYHSETAQTIAEAVLERSLAYALMTGYRYGKAAGEYELLEAIR
jgi:hypothetical protein